jgi:hypothetical protein
MCWAAMHLHVDWLKKPGCLAACQVKILPAGALEIYAFNWLKALSPPP